MYVDRARAHASLEGGVAALDLVGIGEREISHGFIEYIR